MPLSLLLPLLVMLSAAKNRSSHGQLRTDNWQTEN
jgi:hypothetical protein